MWRAFRTPCGRGTLHVTARPADGEVVATAWGEGADWLLERLPVLLVARAPRFGPRLAPNDHRRR
ncbi:hypothetical protein [Kitasatospora aureofaciens]|uniref:hypothetical protein n=1 Tax=Kitasatospora aureofaciens TaxID=1894 RepID=UPI0037CBED10